MELGQREKLLEMHPCMDVNTRICVVGGGPSGLSAAYALAKLGYQNVSVLEKHHTVGGMCESVEIQGRIYDLGGQVVAANSAPTITRLAEELEDVEFEDMKSHKLALIDCNGGKFQDLNVQTDYMSIIPLTMKLQAIVKETGNIGIHAVSGLLADPAPEFVLKNGLQSIPKSVAYGYTASGYGFVEDMPYAYVHEFARTSMLGKIRRVKGGYTSLWEKLKMRMPAEVFCSTQVVGIERDSNSVRVGIKNRETQEETTMEFDKIIFSGATPLVGASKVYRSSNSTDLRPNLFALNEVEEELFCKVRTIDYYTTVAKIKGLEHLPVGFYYCKRYVEDPTTIGHPVAMQKFYQDTDIFLFWSYGNSDNINKAAVSSFVCENVKNMGAQVESVILQRCWTYFPHITAQDMKSGFYDRLEEELQGRQNTYYVGGLMAFELTELNSIYAIDLVCKHFASDTYNPTFPYVKRLFPLNMMEPESHCKIRELGEIPGVEFPNLATVDEYLHFWASHKIVGNRTVYSWINNEGKVVDKRTYQDVNARTSLIARKLLASNKPVIKPGDTVLLLHPPGLDFVDAFFGCLRARVLAVPVLPPDPLHRGGQALAKVGNVAKSCNAVAILSTYSYHAAVRAAALRNMLLPSTYKDKAAPRWPDLPWLHTESWTNKNPTDKKPPSSWSWSKISPTEEQEEEEALSGNDNTLDSKPRPEDVCFLQFTSGSTGDAKGVMITNAGLVHNVKLMHRHYKSTSRTVLVPNFAFELLVRRLESNRKKQIEELQAYDLSTMLFLMVSAEPVRQKTLKRFVELMGPCGLREEVLAPGYGLAENSVFVCVAWGAGKPIYLDWQGRVCCGTRNYTRTGDLGRVVAGKLFVTGRIKDLIIVGGRNVYSSDVEKTVETCSEFIRPGCCAVIGVPEETLASKGLLLSELSDQVGLVVIAEIRDEKMH
ncbi:hypothetical protein KI387_014640 [Taxus chinensis]|uniref:AMP-dependent synthetase/ligase domain-containing protein n=1 Tax=Taxus chinensis TaxID=29808 RepID=A0AA38FI88_TAXCH|nr:hypothetical protein KI387_014640 [Taxus chinensis]